MQKPALVALAEHPVFAQPASIIDRVYETYDFLLECVAPDLWSADSKGRRVTPDIALDPVSRHAWDQALRSIRDTPACRRQLAARADPLHAGATLAATEERAGIHQGIKVSGHRLNLLSDPALPAASHRQFEALFRRHLSAGENADHLAGCTVEESAMVRAAVELMLTTAPELCSGLVRHARYIVAVDGPDAFDSASTQEIPGTAFVALRCMRTPERLAEALVHEFVHLRLYDLQTTRSIFAPAYDTESAPTVAPEWHRDSKVSRWPVDRALAAAHVYVHLAAWFEQRAVDGGGPDAEQSAETAVLRAASLLDKVARHAQGCLGPAGQDFLRWLTQVHEGKVGPRPRERVPS
ncbi:hypothetical protein DT019_15915 [Streptomyces sp. SDr-06]|nr:hypothetical protein DT019_15915 [Streptomyces sp. SDr-06]